MKYAAFFRNLNLGRQNCPTKTQFEQAFVTAGADDASSFLTNGTMVFSIKARANPSKLLAVACKTLRAEFGLKEPAYVRSVAYLSELVVLDPFASLERSAIYACCVSFLHAEFTAPPGMPLESKRRDVEVIRLTAREAFCISRMIGNTPGSPNAFLEKTFGSPATTRVWNTIVRLVQKYA